VAVGTLVPRPFRPASDDAPRSRRILVLANPIHTDIAIPLTPDVQARFAFLEEAGVPIRNQAAKWLILGWGGRAFYLETPTWSDLRAGPVLRALTFDRSVMHADVAGNIPEPYPGVMGFDVGEEAFQRLVTFMGGSFERSDGRPLLIAGKTYGATDRFFEANGHFNALVGCNTWTGRSLREAGLQTGWWNPLPALLSLSLRIYN